MFGINDSNQDTNPIAPSNHPVEGPVPLPPSPFMDNQSSAQTASSAPAAPVHSDPQSAPMLSTGIVENEDQLVGIKAQALSSLAPLVNHLDQTPEEKFKTTMMLIQASDNSGLVKEAYEAANQITDEKARAQALLDVVNEINYFTQKQK